MNEKSIIGAEYLRELEAEATATRQCLENVAVELFDWKPHEKSMPLGYLSILVAEIPKWIHDMVETLEIDLATYEHIQPSTTEELVAHFDDNMTATRKVLENVTDDKLAETFYLKANEETVLSSPLKEMIGSTINHLVHHRGQLTVYLRLNDIAVPSIYGPSADAKGF